jgi:hypothetical protein
MEGGKEPCVPYWLQFCYTVSRVNCVIYMEYGFYYHDSRLIVWFPILAKPKSRHAKIKVSRHVKIRV